MLDAATAPRRDQLDDAGRGRADNLQAWLHHTCNPDTDGRTGDADDHDTDTGADTDTGRDADTDGHTDTDTDADTDTGADTGAGRDTGGDGGGDGGTGADAGGELAGLPASALAHVAAGRRLAPPKLLVRIELESLLGGQVPAAVLTRLVGGKLRLTSAAARRVVEQAGASVRAVVVDDGQVVGVGRASRVSPGWLTDALYAVHERCTGPLCDRPALGADIDHAIEWAPSDGHSPAGATVLDNLGPLCDGTNRDRAATGWHPHQHHRGLRTWRHARSGLKVTSIPTTWRPPAIRNTTGPPKHPPHGTDPPDDPLPF